MIIVPVKEGDSIDKALKSLKKKFERIGYMKELRNRKKYTKPSVAKRDQLLKAKYVQHLKTMQENA